MDVISELRELDKGRKTRWGGSKKYVLKHEGRAYPPKAVLGLAVCLVVDVNEWEVSDFSGGEPANRLLHSLGFEVSEKEFQPGLQ